MDTLKPCPAGTKARLTTKREDYLPRSADYMETPIIFYKYGVTSESGFSIPTIYKSESEAIKAWNTRATPQPGADVSGLQDRIDEHEANAVAYERIIGPKSYPEVAGEIASLQIHVSGLIEALEKIQACNMGNYAGRWQNIQAIADTALAAYRAQDGRK